MRKRVPRKRSLTAAPRVAARLPDVPEVVGKAPDPKPPASAAPEPRVGAGMTEQDILELVNHSYD